MGTQFLDKFSESVWETTYKHHTDNSIDDTLQRVATSLASVEKTPELQKLWGERFNELLTDFKVVPGGRILANAGTNFKGTTLLNCFVGPKPKYDQDSIEGIFSILTNQVLTLKSEGGWGMNFSFIRPRGSFIHGIGVETPGAVKYMEIFNTTSDVITAGSGKKPKKGYGGKTKIRKGAMMSVLDCVSGETEISTLSGKIPIKDLVGKNPLLYCTDGRGNIYIRKAEKIWSKGRKKTVKILLDDDSHLKCTPEHLIMLNDGSYKEAKDLKFGDSVAVFHKRLYQNYYHIGVTGKRKCIPEHVAVAEYKYGKYPEEGYHVHHIDFKTINNQPENLEVLSLLEHYKKHEETTLAMLKQSREKITNERRGKTWEEFYGKKKGSALRIKWTQNLRKNNKKPAWNKGLTGESYKDHYQSGFSNQFVENSNHKVVSVLTNTDEEEVFDISVPDFHNFVANGVFVHNCWHPDLEEFITAKLQEGRLNKFNLSVNCSNEFMDKISFVEACKTKLLEAGSQEEKEALQKKIDELDTWDLIFPDTRHPKYKSEWDGNMALWKKKGYDFIVHKTLKITDLWELIMQSTYNRNDPGVLFLDRANETHCYSYGEGAHISSTNPCGEQTLPFSGTCNLGSLNLTQFVTNEGKFDFNKLDKYVPWLTRMLDNVNDVTETPIPEYKESIRKSRRIGMGVMGWGSMLYMMRIRFGSKQAEELKHKIMQRFTYLGINTSIDLAIEKGMFADCNPVLHADAYYFKLIELDKQTIDRIAKYGIRNSSLFSCQPTGNTGVLANVVSGGIEPLFLDEYIRTVIVDGCPQDMIPFTPKYWEGEFKETEVFKWVKEGTDKILRGEYNGCVYKIDKNRGLTQEVMCTDYGVRWLRERGLWDNKADWAVTSSSLSVQEHLTDMKGFSKWIDSSISKTVNITNEYPYEDFKNLYLDAYSSGVLKGITTYRAGTMMSVLSAVSNDTKVNNNNIALPNTKAPKRPTELPGELHHFTIDGKKYYVAVGLFGEEQKPYEIFVGINESRNKVYIPKDVFAGKIIKRKRGEYIFDNNGDLYELTISHGHDTVDALTRILSASLRHGCDLKFLIEQLLKTHGPMTSFSKLLARTLKKYIPDGTESTESCPTCSSKLIFKEGCKACSNCEYTVCG